MGGRSSKRAAPSRYSSFDSSSNSWGHTGFPQSHYQHGPQPSQLYPFPATPQGYGGQAPAPKRKLERKYSKIDDDYNNLEQAPRGGGGGGGGGGRSGGGGGSRDYLGRGPKPGTWSCFNCGLDGHWARDCKAGDWKNKCYRCGDRGHIERNCQNSPKKLIRGRSCSRTPSPKRGRSRSYSRSRSYR